MPDIVRKIKEGLVLVGKKFPKAPDIKKNGLV